jgi:hypothetical protein
MGLDPAWSGKAPAARRSQSSSKLPPPTPELIGVEGLLDRVSGQDLEKRFELLTPRFVVWCSIQLSYERATR